MTIDELREAALSLSLGERAELAAELLASLDDLSEAETERLWLEEAARRAAELESGAARAIPADEVLAAARSRLKTPRKPRTPGT